MFFKHPLTYKHFMTYCRNSLPCGEEFSWFRSEVHHVRIVEKEIFSSLAFFSLCIISLAQEIGCEGQQVLFRPQSHIPFLLRASLLSASFPGPTLLLLLLLFSFFFSSSFLKCLFNRNSPGPSRTPCSITGFLKTKK